MKRSLFAAIIGVVVVGVFIAVLAAPRPKRQVRVVYPKIVASLPHFVAQKHNIYRNHRLVVEATPVPKSPDMIDAVLAEKCDFLPAVSLVDAMNASVDKDSAVVTVLSHSRMRKDILFEALLVTSGSTIASLADLDGRTIGVFPGGTSEASIKWYLGGLGIPVKSIRFQAVSPREQIEALLAGKVDVVHAYEPEKTLGVLKYHCRPISPSIYAAISEPASIGCTAISTKLMKRDPDLARDIIAAWDEAVDYIRKHDAEARKILAEELSIPSDVAQACTWVDVTKAREFDRVSLEKFIEKLRKMKPQQIRDGQLPSDCFYEPK